MLVLLLVVAGLNMQAQTDTTQAKPAGVYEKLTGWYMDNMNYATVTVLMTIESSFIPFPSEVVIPPAGYKACEPGSSLDTVEGNKWLNMLLVVLFGTLGAVLGAIINYVLSYYLGRPIIYKFADSRLGHFLLLDSEKVKKAETYFLEHGKTSTLVGRFIPAIRQLISIPAGLAKMPLGTFVLFTAIGAFGWNTVLVILGYIAHGQQDLINRYSDKLSVLLLILAGLFVLYLIYNGLKKPKNKQHE